MGYLVGLDSALARRKRGFDSLILHKIANRNWKATSGHERETVEQSRIVTIEKVRGRAPPVKACRCERRGSIPLQQT